MSSTVFAIAYVLFLWWFSTGLILFLDGLPRWTHRWSMLAISGVLLGALYGLSASCADPSVSGAVVAFTCGLLIWGWHEASFLLGYVTGPRQTPCPINCSAWRRLCCAVETVLYHEFAIALTAVLVVSLTAGGVNQIGTWTFLILWWMRLSTKTNVFLGVPNLAEEWLPEHLEYLKSYFRRRPMNLFFPVAVSVSTIVTYALVQQALLPGIPIGQSVGLTLLAVLMGLAVIEHWFIVLPMPSSALWAWGLKSRSRIEQPNANLHITEPVLEPDRVVASRW